MREVWLYLPLVLGYPDNRELFKVKDIWYLTWVPRVGLLLSHFDYAKWIIMSALKAQKVTAHPTIIKSFIIQFWEKHFRWVTSSNCLVHLIMDGRIRSRSTDLKYRANLISNCLDHIWVWNLLNSMRSECVHGLKGWMFHGLGALHKITQNNLTLLPNS